MQKFLDFIEDAFKEKIERVRSNERNRSIAIVKRYLSYSTSFEAGPPIEEEELHKMLNEIIERIESDGTDSL